MSDFRVRPTETTMAADRPVDPTSEIATDFAATISDEVQAELSAVFSDEGATAGSADAGASGGGDGSQDAARPRRFPVGRWLARVRSKNQVDDDTDTEGAGDDSSPVKASPVKASPVKTSPVKTMTSGKKRVVISDDDSGPAPAASPAASAAGASRFRQRRIAIRRAAGRRRLRWFSVAGIAVAVVLVVLLLLTSPILSIREVQVEGNVYADPTVLGEVISDLKGEPILTADLHGAELRLEAIPWVREVSLSSHLPSRVLIQIVEREPIGFYRAVDGFNRVIDRDGRVLDVIEGDPLDYVPIRGTGPNLSAGDSVGQPFLGAAQLVNALPSDLRARLVSMAVSAEGEVSMTLTDEVEVLFGRPDDFQTKLVGVVNEIKKQGSSKYAIIDVSSGEPSVR